MEKKKRSQKRIEYKTGINKVDFQKYGSKKLIKEINDFNSRLKNFLGKKLISKDTYTTLLFNKDKRDYYKKNILNAKQLKEFVSELKNLNKKTIQMSKKNPNMTKWEMSVYDKRQKYFDKYKDLFHHDYSDIKFNVKKLGRELYFKKVLASKYAVQGQSLRYRDAVKRAYRNAFGEDNPEIDKLADWQLDELSHHPNFDIHDWYISWSPEQKKKQKMSVDRLIKGERTLKRRDKKKKKSIEEKLLSLFDSPSTMPEFYVGEDIPFD